MCPARFFEVCEGDVSIRVSSQRQNPHSWHVVRVYGTKASKMSQKACLEFVAAPQPARAAGTHRLLDLCTPWDPGSAQIQQE